MDRIKLLATSVLAVMLLCAGCSVVTEATATGVYSDLSSWKQRADIALDTVALDKRKYAEAQIAVNAWIEAKQTELAGAGARWFTTVDLKQPEDGYKALEQKVKDSGVLQAVTPASGWSDWVKPIIDILFGQLTARRTEEAMRVSGRIGAYKWAPWRPAIPQG